MKGRSFDTFQVSPGNQEAYTVCRRVALLEEMGPALVVLLGPEGCGKSHLLWAIAKQVRAGTLPAGLALLTPDDIPEKVRGLVEDSSPLQGRRAMLLVDGLERFDGEVRRLEAIIDIFLACQHPVILATSVHPNRLERLSVPLVNRLAGARIVEMEARLPESDSTTADRVRALEEMARELQRQRDLLHDQLAASEALRDEAERSAEAAHAQAAEAGCQAEERSEALAEMRAALDQAQADVAAVESRALEQHAEAERANSAWQTAVRALESAASEKAALEARLAESEAEAAYALAQQGRLQGQLSVARMEAEGVPALRADLAAAEHSIAEAMEALGAMRGRHAALCEGLATDLGDVVEGIAAAGGGNLGSDLQTALGEAIRAQTQLRESLVATRERLKAVEFEWAKSRKVLAIQTAEMDALRYAAAGQVAQANIQVGEMEHRIGLLEAALDALRANRPEGGTEGGAPGKAWSMALENMQVQLAALRESRSGDGAVRAGGEQALFESDFFEALPEDFEGYKAPAGRRPLPGTDGDFQRFLDGALGEAGEDGAIDLKN